MTTKTKAKPIASSEDESPTDNPAPSSLLQSAKTQQEKELTDLQTQMDALSDEYAARARAIVLAGLLNGRRKARAEILTIDIPAFFASEGNGSPLPSPQNLALSPSNEGEPTC